MEGYLGVIEEKIAKLEAHMAAVLVRLAALEQRVTALEPAPSPRPKKSAG